MQNGSVKVKSNLYLWLKLYKAVAECELPQLYKMAWTVSPNWDNLALVLCESWKHPWYCSSRVIMCV